MKTTLLAATDLDERLQDRWRRLQQRQPLLASPYFAPEFTLAAAAVRPDVRIGVLEDGGDVVAFFPFQQQWGMGRPVAGRLSDHHGLVCAPGLAWDWPALLQACRLGYWQFDHLPVWQRPPGPLRLAQSPGLDLSGGFEAWRRRRIAAGARRIAELPRKARKLAREVGPLRFEAHSRDPAVLAQVLAWKSGQCRRTGAQDCFEPRWARDFVQRIAATDTPHFGGRLSTLHAGDQLVAAHFGMRSTRVWHWWFPVYSAAHAPYSPGALLLLALAEAAAAQGHDLLDLGKGPESYKASFADTATTLAEGFATRESAIAYLRTARRSAGRWLRQSPLAQPVRPLLRHFGRLGAAMLLVPGLLDALDPA